MGVIEATQKLKMWRGFYDFAVDGGAVGTIVLRSNHGVLPIGAVVMGGFLKVLTGFTTGASGTGALTAEGAGDLLAATIVSGAPYSTTGRKSILPVFTGASSVETTAARSPSFVIATGALTAGKFELVLFYL